MPGQYGAPGLIGLSACLSLTGHRLLARRHVRCEELILVPESIRASGSHDRSYSSSLLASSVSLLPSLLPPSSLCCPQACPPGSFAASPSQARMGDT